MHGRYDTTGAVRSVLSITGALGWRQGYDVLEAMGDVTETDTDVGLRARRYDRGVARCGRRSESGPGLAAAPVRTEERLVPSPPRPRAVPPCWLLVLPLVLVLGGCTAPLQPQTAADKVTPPKLGACYNLTPEDTERRRATPPSRSPCSSAHTSETFAIGTLPDSTGKDYDSADARQVDLPTCEKAFEKFLGVDESLAMRVQLSWAWFRPSERGWDKGARWYRCDLVGGPADATSYAELPDHRRRDCSAPGRPRSGSPAPRGATVLKSEKVPCSEQHDWRAVTTIKLGSPEDPYPGDRSRAGALA